jgi:hypothetical protein
MQDIIIEKSYIQSPPYKQAFMIVLPVVAAEWLKRNFKGNRKPERVDEYARKMTEGKWIPNGNAIRFDRQGRLIDGQNRLMACVKANVPFQTVVMTDCDPEMIDSFDNGLVRTAKHLVSIHSQGELAGNATRTTSAARLIMYFENHGDRFLNVITDLDKKIPPEDVARWVLSHRDDDLFNWALNEKRNPRIITSAHIACLYIFQQHDKDLARKFAESVRDGSDLHPGSPVLAFRERLMKAGTHGNRKDIDRRELIGLFFKTWYLYRTQQSVKTLRWQLSEGLYLPETK